MISALAFRGEYIADGSRSLRQSCTQYAMAPVSQNLLWCWVLRAAELVVYPLSGTRSIAVTSIIDYGMGTSLIRQRLSRAR